MWVYVACINSTYGKHFVTIIILLLLLVMKDKWPRADSCVFQCQRQKQASSSLWWIAFIRGKIFTYLPINFCRTLEWDETKGCAQGWESVSEHLNVAVFSTTQSTVIKTLFDGNHSGEKVCVRRRRLNSPALIGGIKTAQILICYEVKHLPIFSVANSPHQR